MSREIYISVDIESSGPIPGPYSMLSIGACVVGNPEVSFYTEIKPLSQNAVPEALKVSGFDLEILSEEGEAPSDAIRRFIAWVEEATKGAKAVFVGFNGCFDWQFVNWYAIQFAGNNPFGFGGIDIKSYYMGQAAVSWAATTSSQLPLELQPETPQTHNALDDAKAQASIFEKLLHAQT